MLTAIIIQLSEWMSKNYGYYCMYTTVTNTHRRWPHAKTIVTADGKNANVVFHRMYTKRHASIAVCLAASSTSHVTHTTCVYNVHVTHTACVYFMQIFTICPRIL